MRSLGIFLAFISAIAYGLGSVLQVKGSRSELAKHPDKKDELDFRETIRSMLTPFFLVGTLCDILGFVANALSDRLAPLFLVQSIMATNLLFAAIFSYFILKNKLSRYDLMSIIIILLGLVILGLTASQEGHREPSSYLSWALLAASVILVAIGIIWQILKPSKSTLMSSCIAGLLFGVVAISVRITHSIYDPSFMAIIIAGAGAFYLYTTALESGKVSSVLAAIIVGETTLPAIVGLWLLGDSTISGFEPLAGLGFCCAVGGAIMLTRSPHAAVA